ncbi:MAG: hypothetical protein IKQ15_04070 [Kiritimatiellae bacterium]|nr:hypothetical protein [Kiritimatiellia bacterium]
MRKWLVGLLAAGLCAASAWATTDVLTAGDFEATSSTYKDFSGVTKDSGAVYAGNSGKTSDGAIQLRSNNSNSGIVTTESGGTASKVTLAWNAATVDDREVSVYGSTDAYTAATDLYAAASQGTLLGSLKKGDGTTELEIEGEYAYIGLRSKSGALYLDSVEIEWAGGTPPVFSVKLDPAEDFEVFQGKSASITATVKGAQGDVTYSWSVNGTPIDLAGNVYTVDSAELGEYEVSVEVSDGVADPLSASVKYTVVEAPVVTGDVLTRDTTGVTGSQYKDWTATGDSGTVYAGNSAGGNDSIQLRTTSPAGIVITESAGSDVASVTVEWNDATAAEKRSLEIYGSADAYAGPAALYEASTKGELLGTIARDGATLEIPEGYPYVGILAKGGALYLTSVAFEFAGASGPSVSLSASATEVEVGGELTITATAKNFSAEPEWAWEGNDGGNADGAVYTVNTAVAGDFTIKATATAGDEIAEKEITVTVTPALVPHAITVTTDGNGTAEADVAEAKAGDPVNLTVVPNEGFKLASITVNGEAITGTSFEMPDEDVTVAVAFVEKPVLSGDVLTRETTGVEGSQYKDWTATGDSGTKYAGQSAGGNDSIQLRATSPAGIVITESAGSDVASVTVEWNDATAEKRSLEIYGSADAYAGPADLYGDAKGELLGTIARDGAALEIPEGYPYVGILAKGGALYLTSVAFDFGGASGPSVSLSASATEVEVGGELTVTATAKNFSADVEWAWEGNDGGSADGAVYTVNTAVAGEFTIKATATAGDEIAEKEITVTVTPALVPHAITVTTDGNGTAEADVATAKAGEPVNLTVVPNDGYKLDSITVNGEAITGTSFEMPDADVTVAVTFKEITGEVYKRVESADDFEEGAEYLVVAVHAKGNFTSALKNETNGTRIGVEEVVVNEDNTVVTDDDSIVWTIQAGAEEGQYVLYNAAKGVYAAATKDDNVAQLLEDGTAALAQWTLKFDDAPAVGIWSVSYPERWLSRNSTAASAYFATYKGTQTAPFLFKKAGPSAPSVSLSASATEVEVGGELTITATAKNFSADVAWAWEGNDGGSADGAVYTVNTAVAGEFTIKATATAGDEIAEKSITVTVSEPGPQPGEPAIVFGGDTEGVVGQVVNFTVTAVNISDPTLYLDGFEFPADSSLTEADLTQDYPNVSFTPDAAGDYVFNYSAGEGDEYVASTLTITVTDEPGPQPTEPGITKMTIASGKMTIEFIGEGAQVLLSDDMETWAPVDGAISPFSFDMKEAGKKYIGVR